MKNTKQKAPKSLGLYIHIPFCRRKCLYCDFCSFPAQKPEVIEQYVNKLCNELCEKSEKCKNHILDTVYFGGGTPSLLNEAQLEKIFSIIRKSYILSENAEITLECNPLTHLNDGLEYFKKIRKLGINRLSIGVQSANDAELKMIGRGHTFSEAQKTYFDAREAGFENISLDLIFALPEQNLSLLGTSLKALLSLNPEHISIYSLQLEEGSALYRIKNKFTFPSDEETADMYELIVSKMRERGYEHYEISNFAKVGFESRHNSKYWTLDEYIGAGVASHSFFGGIRSENTQSLTDYLSGICTVEEKLISQNEQAEEYIMLGLRTKKGISKTEFNEKFGKDFDDLYTAKLEKFISGGFVTEEKGCVSLTEKGFEVSNYILSELLEFNY